MDAALAKKLAIAAVVGLLIVLGVVVTGADAKKRLRLTCDQTTDAIFKTAQGFRAKYNSMGFTIEDAPYGILVVNITGSFFLGLLSDVTPPAFTVVGVGGLGAYTTFSSFARDVVALAGRRQRLAMVWYVLASCGGGVAAAALGVAIVS